MNKKELNASCINILMMSEELISDYTEEKTESLSNARFEEEEIFYEQSYNKLIDSCAKIKNNALIFFLLNKNEAKCELIDPQTYEISTEYGKHQIAVSQLKSLLGKDFNAITKKIKGQEDSAKKQKEEKPVKQGESSCTGVRSSTSRVCITPTPIEQGPVDKQQPESKEPKIEKSKVIEPKIAKPIAAESVNPKKKNNTKKQKEDKKQKADFDSNTVPDLDFSLDFMDDEFEDLLLQENDIEIAIKKPVWNPISKPVRNKEQLLENKAENQIIAEKESEPKIPKVIVRDPKESEVLATNHILLKKPKKTEIRNDGESEETKAEKVKGIMVSSKKIKQNSPAEEIEEDIPIISDNDDKLTNFIQPRTPMKSDLPANGFTNSNMQIENADNIVISKQDLIIDNYLITYMNQNKEKVKTVSILVTPLKLDAQQSNAIPIMVIAKSGREVKTVVSQNIERPSIPITIGDETFIIRGSYNESGFQTLLYSKGDNNYETKKELHKIRPRIIENNSHNTKVVGDDIIHIFPLSTKNNGENYVKVLVCIENKKNKSFQTELTSHNNFMMGNYEISNSWNGDKLDTKIKIK